MARVLAKGAAGEVESLLNIIQLATTLSREALANRSDEQVVLFDDVTMAALRRLEQECPEGEPLEGGIATI